ncbi:MAG TPA: hypothetical protein VF067_08135 [Sphingomicrobium sp.]
MKPRILTLALAIVAMSACRADAPEQARDTKNAGVTEEAPGPTEKPRWEMASGTIAYQPICESFRAPELPSPLADAGVVPAFLFSVDGAPADEVDAVRQGLMQNGFTVAGGTVTINGTEILFASGDGGVLKTQDMADRLFGAMCGLETEHVKLVAARYNAIDEANRMN